MVNTLELITKLEVYGTIVYCTENTEDTYVIFMTDWVGTIDNFVDIVSVEIIPTYPETTQLTLIDGVIKSEFSITQ